MAMRPVFLSRNEIPVLQAIDVEFMWHSGFSRAQKERSVAELHTEFSKLHEETPVLEVSSKSKLTLGRELSAFNLQITHPSLGMMSLESAFQGSKVFTDLGQIEHAYVADPRMAKGLAREADQNHSLVEFRWKGEKWPLEPKTFFYDWLYCSALRDQPNLMVELSAFKAFTDIEFNPAKSFNCQARSCAIAVGLMGWNLFDEALGDRERFVELAYGKTRQDDKETTQLALM